mmetsp:Transcript_8463/g.20908  ORF Transcript_8463/g.20908 Transcript_8463/m.20908 type:complete len:105 (+) Transcript_8463:1266-1580(+)
MWSFWFHASKKHMIQGWTSRRSFMSIIRFVIKIYLFHLVASTLFRDCFITRVYLYNMRRPLELIPFKTLGRYEDNLQLQQLMDFPSRHVTNGQTLSLHDAIGRK